MFPNSIMYSDVWTRWVDDNFIRELYGAAYLNNKSLTIDDVSILEEVRKVINKQEKREFDLDEIKTRFQLAADRYKTWNSIINRIDVNYNIFKNTVVATQDTWEEICSEHTLGEIYEIENEHMWVDLRFIFHPNCKSAIGEGGRTPISTKMWTDEELMEQSVNLQDQVDGVRHIRKIISDPMNKHMVGEYSTKPPEEIISMPENPNLGWPDWFNGTPEERVDRAKNSKAKKCLEF